MINLSPDILSELSKQNKYIIPVVEIYPRETVDITSMSAPASAIGRFSNTCYTWTNNEGSYLYDAKVSSWPEVQSYLGKEINTAEIEFSNVARGEDSMSRFVLNNKIKGCWMVIRLIYPDKPNESQVVFWGKCERPGGINNESITLSAKQDLGNFKQEIPFRNYGVRCPLEFAKPLGGCLGDQTLEEKSVSYRQAVAEFGSAGCNKLFSTCTLLENTRYFQGQRVVAVSGQFSYITIEEVVKRVLFWTKRKKIQVVKTDNWSSVNQSEGSEDIPVAFGRCQIQGHPFTWADQGQTVKSLLGFCEGRISAFAFVRSRTQGINIVSKVEHLGDWGGVGTQQLDSLYNGASGYNSRLAYLEVVTDGSSPTQVDDAPIITAVIRGLEIPVPDDNGVYSNNEWTNNPVHISRFLLTDTRFGRIPTYRMDDVTNLDTSYDCDELIEDRTNEEFIVLPANEVENYGVTYRRFRSAGRYSAYKDIYNNAPINEDLTGLPPADVPSGPSVPIEPDLPPVPRFTANPLSAPMGTTVSFTDTSTHFPSTWDWDFGDGNTSTEQYPTHAYSTPGSYTVSLAVTNAFGGDSLVKPDYITVTGGTGGLAPVVSFTASPTYTPPATPVAFTDFSTNTPTSWLWNFGDGSTSTLQNPSHSYALEGVYNVTLVATNAAGSGSKTRSGYITVSTAPYTGPVAEFSCTPLVGNAPLTAYFTDESTGSPDSWEWDFGDGEFSTSQNPSHVYDTEGTYSISLTVSNADGSDSETKNGLLAVIGSAPSLTVPPEFEDPEIRWFDPFAPYVLPPVRNVLRQKYTLNGAIQEKTSILDFLYERVLPTFKGYINYSPNGLIQIKNRRKADNAYVRSETRSGRLDIAVTNVRPWKANRDGYLLIGVSLETAEIREVKGFDYSTACNGFSIVAESTGSVTATAVDIADGTRSTPGLGYILLSGTPSPQAIGSLAIPIDPGDREPGDGGPGGGSGGGVIGPPPDEVKITFGEGDNEFTISYIADGIEDLNTFTRMLIAFLNANPQFSESFTAYTLPNNPYKIWIRCEAGYLIFDKPLEFTHDVGEEVLRVQAVFENCGELTANQSAQFDNIIENTFKWNEDEEDEVNAITAKYTSAVDDFHLTNIMPRAGWDTIDLEGELVKDELDLTLVDNYWQAAYLTKGEAIDRIDGNLHFSFMTTLLAMRLELGDVVAVRHDSGDGALNYVPCWITKCSVSLDDFEVELGMKLYLSAAFDYDVQPIEPLLTTTLNAALYPDQPPTTTGTNGGVSQSSEPVVYRPDYRYYEQFKKLGYYSPTGKDIV